MTIGTRSLVIVGCSQRKRQTSRLIEAIVRYDGPIFRVLRKFILDKPETPIDIHILSGRFGLISSTSLVPRYTRRLITTDHAPLLAQVNEQFRRALDEVQPDRLFISVGRNYWPLLEESVSREVSPGRVVLATGGIGGRASQLAHWLYASDAAERKTKLGNAANNAVLLGTTIRLTRDEVLREARKALIAAPAAAHRFETWYVELEGERIAAKWLASILFHKPVAQFRTADARRVLSLLGVECKYDSRY